MKDDTPQVPLTNDQYNEQSFESDYLESTARTGDWSEEIARLAYAYWEADGRVDGRDLDHWLTAERDVMRRHAQGAK